jgi:hypothetical protein
MIIICAFDCTKQNKEKLTNISILLLIFIIVELLQIYKKTLNKLKHRFDKHHIYIFT